MMEKTNDLFAFAGKIRRALPSKRRARAPKVPYVDPAAMWRSLPPDTAKNLSEDAKVLFTADKLNVEGARLLAAQSIDIQEKVIGEQWRNWRDSEHDSDVQDLVIEEDDKPLSVNDIKGELRWLESQAQAAKRREEIETARAAVAGGAVPLQSFGVQRLPYDAERLFFDYVCTLRRGLAHESELCGCIADDR